LEQEIKETEKRNAYTLVMLKRKLEPLVKRESELRDDATLARLAEQKGELE